MPWECLRVGYEYWQRQSVGRKMKCVEHLLFLINLLCCCDKTIIIRGNFCFLKHFFAQSCFHLSRVATSTLRRERRKPPCVWECEMQPLSPCWLRLRRPRLEHVWSRTPAGSLRRKASWCVLSHWLQGEAGIELRKQGNKWVYEWERALWTLAWRKWVWYYISVTNKNRSVAFLASDKYINLKITMK